MEKSILTFNDLPEVVAQLRDEVMSLKSLLAEQRSVNNAKTVDTHVPMSVDEAAEYLGIPKGTLYMNSKIKPNKSCKKFHARKLSFFVVAFSKMILVMGCKAAKRLYSLASHSQNR